MGNEISTPTAVTSHASNASIKFSLPTEILFEILAFVKFQEAPNIFLVNRYLMAICQVYFHSGTIGQNKVRNVRDLTMELKEGSLAISVERNGTWQSVPVPEVDPPKIFNAFGNINVKKCCQIEAIHFLYKFQSLLTNKYNAILCAHNFFVNNANVDNSEKQINSNSPSSVVVDEKQLFMNLIEQKELLLELKADALSKGIARCLVDVPLIAQFNGCLVISFENEQNLCGLEEDAKLIYGWISSAGTRKLVIDHYDSQKARKLACQIALLFEKAHVNKKEAEKMNLLILLPDSTIVPMLIQKVCNGIGDHLATLRTLSLKCSDGMYTSTYVFNTEPVEYLENKVQQKLVYQKGVEFL